MEIAARLIRPDFNEKAERSVRALRCKTGYLSSFLSPEGKPMILPAPPEDGDFIDIKKFCLRPPFRFIIQ
jgi:hypothetical protein